MGKIITCLSYKDPEVSKLAGALNLNNLVAAAKIQSWMLLHNTELFPSKEELEEYINSRNKEVQSGYNKAFKDVKFVERNKLNTLYPNAQEREDRKSFTSLLFKQCMVEYIREQKANDPKQTKEGILKGEGIQNIRENMKLALANLISQEKDAIVAQKKQKILDNFDLLFSASLRQINELCAIQISPVTFKAEKEKTSDETDSYADNGEGTLNEEMADNLADGEVPKEKYMFDRFEVPGKKTLSKELKAVLATVRQVDPEGNLITDDLGQVRLMNSDVVYSTIMSHMDGIKTVAEMKERLYEMRSKFLWIEDVIDILEYQDDTMKNGNPIVQKAFVGFCKDFNNFMACNYKKDNKGKTSTALYQINESNTYRKVKNSTSSNVKAGIVLNKYSVYDDTGHFIENEEWEDLVQRFEYEKNVYAKRVLGYSQEQIDAATVTTDGIKSISPILGTVTSMSENDLIILLEDTVERLKDDILDPALKAFGIVIEESELISLFNDLVSFNTLIDTLNNIYENAKKAQDIKEELSETNQGATVLMTGKRNALFRKVFSNISAFMESTLESSAKIGGKARYSYQNQSTFSRLMKDMLKVVELASTAGKDSESRQRAINAFNEMVEMYKGDFRFYNNGVWTNAYIGELEKYVYGRSSAITKENFEDMFVTGTFIDTINNKKHIEDSDISNKDQMKFLMHLFFEKYYFKGSTAWYSFPNAGDISTPPCFKGFRYSFGTYDNMDIPYLDYLDGWYQLAMADLRRWTVVEKRREGIKKGTIEAIEHFDSKGDNFFYVQMLRPYKELIRNVYLNYMDNKLSRDVPLYDNKYKNMFDDSTKEQLQRASKNLDVEQFIKILLDLQLKNEFEEENKLYEKLGVYQLENDYYSVFTYFNNNSKSSDKYARVTDINKAKAMAREFFYNYKLAQALIIQLTSIDPAYFGNTVNMQKRNKQSLAVGDRLDTSVSLMQDKVLSPYNVGKRAMESFITLNDNIIKSEFANITSALTKMYDEMIANEKDKVIKDYIIQLKKEVLSAFANTNETDAQAYRMPFSLAKIKEASGTLTDKQRELLLRMDSDLCNLSKTINADFQKREYNPQEIDGILLVTKDFIYSTMPRNTGLTNDTSKGLTDLSKMLVINQNKNSEAALILGSAFIQLSPKLQAIMTVASRLKIDVVQFESAVKVGGQSNIDLGSTKGFEDTRIALLRLITGVTEEDEKSGKVPFDKIGKTIQQLGLERNYIKLAPYDEYRIQQPIPDHIEDEQALLGSLIEKLIGSDMSNDAEFEVVLNKVKGLSITLTKDEWHKMYKKIITTKIIRSAIRVDEKLSDPKKLSELLIESIEGNERYNQDLLQACGLDENGNFNIPLFEPTQATRIVQMINSIIKNRITKLKISGGSLVQLSSYGLTDELYVVHKKDADGNELPAVDYIECYMPAYTKKLLSAYLGVDGTIDMKRLSDDDKDDLCRVIGYRIPTEDKYSMLPLKIKGFMPKAYGNVIMVAKEITSLTGSDFDVDKLFLMVPQLRLKYKNYKKENILKDFNELRKKNKKSTISYDELATILDLIENELEFRDDSVEMELFDFIQDSNGKYGEGKVYTEKKSMKIRKETLQKFKSDENSIRQQAMDELFETIDHSSSDAIDNAIIDMMTSVLTNSDTYIKQTNPGSFDPLKNSSRVHYLLNHVSEEGYRQLSAEAKEKGLSLLNYLYSLNEEQITEKTSQYTEELDITRPSALVYIREMNRIAGQLIGVFATSNVSHAVLQHIPLSITGGNRFRLFGEMRHDLSLLKIPNSIKYISRAYAELVAAAVDAVKEPVFDNLNINTITCNYVVLLTKMGYTEKQIGVLLNTPLLKEFVEHIQEHPFDDYEEYWKELEINIHEEYKDLLNVQGATIADENVSEDDMVYMTIEDRFTEKETIEEDKKKEYYKNLSESLRNKKANLLKKLYNIAHTMVNMSRVAKAYQGASIVSKSNTSKGSAQTSNAKNISLRHRYRAYMGALLWQADRTPGHEGQFIPPIIEGFNKIVNGMLTTPLFDPFKPINLKDKESIATFVKEIMNNPLGLYLVYDSTTIGNLPYYFNQYIPDFHVFFINLIDTIMNMAGKDYITDAMVEKIMRSFYSYYLTYNNKVFGESSIEEYLNKVSYYLNEFPTYFLRQLNTDEDLKPFLSKPFFKSFFLDYSEGIPQLAMHNDNIFTPEFRDQMISDWESMLYYTHDDEGNEIPKAARDKAANLAFNLYQYTFIKYGYDFSNSSPMHFTPISLLMSLPGYSESLYQIMRLLDFSESDRGVAFVNRFLEQFIRHNINDTQFVKTQYVNQLRDDKLFSIITDKGAFKEIISANKVMLAMNAYNTTNPTNAQIAEITKYFPTDVVKFQFGKGTSVCYYKYKGEDGHYYYKKINELGSFNGVSFNEYYSRGNINNSVNASLFNSLIVHEGDNTYILNPFSMTEDEIKALPQEELEAVYTYIAKYSHTTKKDLALHLVKLNDVIRPLLNLYIIYGYNHYDDFRKLSDDKIIKEKYEANRSLLKKLGYSKDELEALIDKLGFYIQDKDAGDDFKTLIEECKNVSAHHPTMSEKELEEKFEEFYSDLMTSIENCTDVNDKVTLMNIFNSLLLKDNKPIVLSNGIVVMEDDNTGAGKNPKTPYPSRTNRNAQRADVTLQLAFDLNTAGENLTVKAAGNSLISHKIEEKDLLSDDSINEVVKNLITQHKNKRLASEGITLNIAGNGIYSFPKSIEQKQLDEFVKKIIQGLQQNNITIRKVISGGQTGIDEAGIKAALQLGIHTEILAPKDFWYKDREGDKKGKENFLKRYNEKYSDQSADNASSSIEEINNTYLNSPDSSNPNELNTSSNLEFVNPEDVSDIDDIDFNDADEVKFRETVDNSETWNQKEELEWLDKVLPQLRTEDRLTVVKGLINARGNKKAWGAVTKGMMLLSELAAKGTTYHEAFHIVSDYLLTPTEKELLIELAKQKYSNASNEELEELLAEDYRRYVLKGTKRKLSDRIIDFFKRILYTVTNWNFLLPTIEDYYGRISEGYYANKSLNLNSLNTNKSVTDNIGTFDSNNDDIRYREMNYNSNNRNSSNLNSLLSLLEDSEEDTNYILEELASKYESIQEMLSIEKLLNEPKNTEDCC